MGRQVPDRRWHAHVLTIPLLYGVVVAGCTSTISPQFFPSAEPPSAAERSAIDRAEDCDAYDSTRNTALTGATRWPFDGQLKLCRARVRADLLRQEYVEAVVEQSAEKSAINTVLLGLAGMAGYHLLKDGVTGTRPLRYLAATGGALYGYATLTQSQARQVVYLAGAEALTCIYAASSNLQIPPAELVDIVDGASQLRKSIESFRTELGTQLESEYRRADRCRTTPAEKGSCDTAASSDGRRLFDAARPKGCTDRTRVTTCDTRLERAAQAAEPELIKAEALWEQVAMKLNELERAGGRVRAATDNVSYSIGREVLKTEASPTAVLSAIESMRGVVSQLSGAAQSGLQPGLPDERAPGLRAVHPAIEKELYAVRNTKARVEMHRRTLSARLKAFADELGNCQAHESLNRISLTPNLEELALTPGRAYTLLAVGTDGRPSVNLIGDADNAIDLQSQPDGSKLQVVVTLRKEKADRNVVASLQFSAPGATTVALGLVYFAPGGK